jgi:AcrR family transcriptional regulator
MHGALIGTALMEVKLGHERSYFLVPTVSFSSLRRTRGGAASGPRSQGKQTREAILAHALKIAAREGLAALTIGRLAKELQMSKSGLFAHFRSKQALELATVEKAREIFANAVLLPAQNSGRGIGRLWNLCDLWLLHVERRVFSGPYFFTGALFEYSDRPGPVAKAIKSAAEEWCDALEEAVEDSQGRREIGRGTRAKQIAFELNGRLVGAYFAFLVGNGASLRDARAALLSRLRELATDTIPVSAFGSAEAWKKHLEHKH